jgi:hypothetical protein
VGNTPKRCDYLDAAQFAFSVMGWGRTGVIDVWESRGHFDRFVEGRLGPKLAELGADAFQGPPDIKEFPVHHYTKP